MKISLLSTLHPYRGGIAQFNHSLIEELEKSHELQLLNFSRQYPSLLFPGKTQYVNKEDRHKYDDAEQILDSINPLSYFRAANKINLFEPELFITRYWMPFFAPSLGKTARLLNRNTKRIAIVDNAIPHEQRFIDKKLTSYFLNSFDGFVSMSEEVESDLLRMGVQKNKHLRLVHPLYNHFGERKERNEAKSILQLDHHKKTLLFFGLIRDYKGLDELILAFDQLDESYQLVIAGECYGSFEKYDSLIQNNRNKDRIHVHQRFIADSEVSTFFSAADVCVLPYRSATQSGITAISMHFETPILVTDVGGLKEMVEKYNVGRVIDSCSNKLITKGIIEFFEQRSSSKVIPFEDLKKDYAWDTFANKLVDFCTIL